MTPPDVSAQSVRDHYFPRPGSTKNSRANIHTPVLPAVNENEVKRFTGDKVFVFGDFASVTGSGQEAAGKLELADRKCPKAMILRPPWVKFRRHGDIMPPRGKSDRLRVCNFSHTTNLWREGKTDDEDSHTVRPLRLHGKGQRGATDVRRVEWTFEQVTHDSRILFSTVMPGDYPSRT